MMTNKSIFLAACSFALSLAACATDGSLERDDVEALPAGDAVGSAASGSMGGFYKLQACSAGCGNICEIGSIDDHRDISLVEADGELRLTFDDGPPAPLSSLPPVLIGGIDADRTFKVGGLATVEATAEAPGGTELYLVDGSFSDTSDGPDAILSSTLTFRVVAANKSSDCTMSFEMGFYR